MDHLGDFSEPLKCWSFFWRQGRTAGPMDREWPGVIRIHPIKARGGMVPSPSLRLGAGTHRLHLPERQAIAERATPMAKKGQPRCLRTVMALLLALSLVFGMAAIQADPSAAASATAVPGARAAPALTLHDLA
jgi:hypothetical protein